MRGSLPVLLVLLLARNASAATVVDASEKVRPTAAVTGVSAATLRAARNEFEPFQIVVDGGSTGLTGVSAVASALVGPSGAIPASEVRLYRLGYLDLTTASNLEGGTRLWPDPLIPDVDEVVREKRNAFPFDVPAGENRVIWVDVHVPKTAAPGVYTGAITLSGLGTIDVVPVTLTVLDLELPSTSSMPTSYGLAWNQACVAHYGSYEACGYDEGILRMNTLYAAFMLDHRISAEVAYTGPKADAFGAWDWAGTFDPYYAPLLDGTTTGKILDGARLTSFRYRWSQTADRYAAWAGHFRAKEWFSRTYDYTCDEPPATCAWSDIPTRAAVVRQGDPDMRTLVTTNIADAVANGVDDDIDILVPVVNHLHDRVGTFAGDRRADYDAFLASSPKKELWWYQSCMSHGCGHVGGEYYSGWPSFMVDASGVQNRAMQWLTYLYRISGELYFETVLDLPNAWNSVYDFGGNGDGTLLYPGTPAQIGGTTHVPVSSYRLKMIREGMEDFEYLKRLDDLGDAAFARQVARALFPTPYETRQPAAKLREARELIVSRLAALVGGTPPPPPPAVPTTEALSAWSPVSVDGELSEFAGAPGVTLSGATAGSSARATVRVLWDDQRLYLAYDVQDATRWINQGGRDGEVWNGDGVEVMIDASANGAASPDGDDFHVIVNVAGDLRDERGGGAPWAVSWDSFAEQAVQATAGGYEVEIAIPWSAMGIFPTPGAAFGFDVAINDSDAPGVVRPFDWAGLTAFAQPARWNRLVLGPRGAIPPPPPSLDGGNDDGGGDDDPPVDPPPAGCSATRAGAWPWAISGLLVLVSSALSDWRRRGRSGSGRR